MRKSWLLILGVATLLMIPLNSYAKSRILFVDSYHAGYDWSDKVTEGIKSVLQDKDAAYCDRVVALPLDTFHVNDFDEWKIAFTRIQANYDVMIMGNTISVKGWDPAAAERLVLERTRIPTGSDLDWVAPFSFIAYTRVAEEQGRWAAQTALKILEGTPSSSIPVAHNIEDNLIVNLKVAKAAGIKVTPDFLRKASRVIQ